MPCVCTALANAFSDCTKARTSAETSTRCALLAVTASVSVKRGDQNEIMESSGAREGAACTRFRGNDARRGKRELRSRGQLEHDASQDMVEGDGAEVTAVRAGFGAISNQSDTIVAACLGHALHEKQVAH